MAFNGSGQFLRLFNWVNDKNAGINITASRTDSETDGIATGLSNCVTRDGQSPATQNLPMGGFAHTNVGTGTARNQYATIAQTEDGVINWGVAGGGVDTLTVAYAPALSALVDGQLCYVRATGTNLTSSPNFSPNGLTARTITKLGGGALNGSDWTINTELVFRYNLANTRWEWLNALASQSSTFSDSAFKIQDNGDATKQLAFEVSGVSTGTTRTLTIPNASTTIVGTDVAQTLTNKALQDSTTTIVDDGDATKKLAFQCSGITTATTRTVTIPDKSGTMAMTSDIPAANATQTTSASPAAITSTTGQMLGLAATITPNKSGSVLITISGAVLTTNGNATLAIKTGTGGAPSNGAAFTGTTRGIAVTSTWSGAAPNNNPPFSMTALVTGLTLSTAIWIDLDASSTAGAVTLTGVCVTAVEL